MRRRDANIEISGTCQTDTFFSALRNTGQNIKRIHTMSILLKARYGR